METILSRRSTYDLSMWAFCLIILSTSLFAFASYGCRHETWPSALPEVRLDEVQTHLVSRDTLLEYLKGKYRESLPLIMEDTIRGEYFWPVFICGIPGRVYISKWNPPPPGDNGNFEMIGFNWVAFGSHQVDSLQLDKWVTPDILKLSRFSLFETIADRLKSSYNIRNQQPFRDGRYAVALHILGGKLRLMPELRDTIIEIQFLNARAR